MDNQYQQEIDDFNNNFSQWKDKRIVLYGIGRYTATLMDGLTGFNIVGLMDRDPANIGKLFFGVPVLSNNEVKHLADVVIINTAGTYWELIFKRIKDLGVPVFFRNGNPARLIEKSSADNEYWKSKIDDLEKMADNTQVVSFDFYDTLFSRRVYEAKDVIKLVEEKLGIYFLEVRSNALKNLPNNYSFDELYDEIARISNFTEIKKIKSMELELEKEMLVPRAPMLNLLRRMIDGGKEVYVITDMYLPKSFFESVLKQYGVNLKSNHLLLSGELKKSKADGGLWKYFRELNCGEMLLHIGDDIDADIKQANQKGIQAFYIANTKKMLELSSLSSVGSKICSSYASSIIGIIISKLFNNPFILNETCGKIVIKSNFEVGYTVFAPVILTFFEWLRKQIKANQNSRIVFMARDGYFLKEDFDEYMACRGESIETVYVGISRQLVMTASAKNDADIWRLAEMPYTGTLSEMLEDRFDIKADDVNSRADIEKYLPQLRSHVKNIGETYKKYIEGFNLIDKDAIIDLGYYGNNQRYLNDIAGTNLRGYYFNANISDGNENTKIQSMLPCFQLNSDKTGEDSGVLKYQIYLESFLTAPYGMVKGVSEDGGFICGTKRRNQIHFDDKLEINEGVKAFIKAYVNAFGNIDLKIDQAFVDEYYRSCFEGGIEFDEDVKRSFYNDNAMMHRMEVNLFE